MTFHLKITTGMHWEKGKGTFKKLFKSIWGCMLWLLMFFGYYFMKVSSVLHSTSEQHISGGREHSGPIQSIPSPEFHSRLHCKRRKTSPIGEFTVEDTTCCSSTRELPLQHTDPRCLQRGGKKIAFCCWVSFSFFYIPSHRPLPVKRLKPLKHNFKSCMTTAEFFISLRSADIQEFAEGMRALHGTTPHVNAQIVFSFQVTVTGAVLASIIDWGMIDYRH